MTDAIEENEVETPKEKAPVSVLTYSKGNMPMALVWFIKFHEDSENKSALAAKYFTTSGKVTDITSGSNQKYIVENMKWSYEELSAMKETIDANFVRGQDLRTDEMDDDAWEAFTAANKRKIATTTAEDAEYSLSVIDEIASMEFDGDAVTLAEARSTYLAANPRKSTKKTEEALGETDVEQVEEEVTASDEDAVEDLLD